MNLLKTNLSLFAYDPKKDKDTNYAAQMQAIIDKAGGEKNLSAKDLSSLAALEKAANEKVDYLNQTGTNKWGAKVSSKYQDALAATTAPTKSNTVKDSTGDGGSKVHYTPPSTTNPALSQAASKTAATPSTYQQLGTGDWDEMYLSPSELKQVRAYGAAYMDAFKKGDYATANYYHDLADDVRANASSGVHYTGGVDGTQFFLIPNEEVPDQEMTADDRWDWAHKKAGLKPTYEPREEIPEQNYDSQGYWDQTQRLIGEPRPEYTPLELTAEQRMGAKERWDMMNDMTGPRPEYVARADTPEQLMSPEERYNAILGIVGDAPEFVSRWDDTKNELARAYLNMNYDNFLNSNQYQALANQYNMQGRNAAQNILGQMAARTGGMASSYSDQVASQAYNNYMAQLSAAAYDMYQGEVSDAYNRAMAAYGFDDVDYGRHMDNLAQWNTNRGYASDAFDKSVAQANYLQERDYNQFLNSLAQWNTDQNNASNTIDRVLSQQNRNQEWDYTQFLNNLAQWNVEHGYATDAIDRTIAQANNNRNYDFGVYESDLGQWNRDYGYAVDAYDRGVAQGNYNQEWNYKVSQTEKTDAMDRIQSFLSTGGLAANIDPALIKASGYTQAELLQLQSYYQSLLNPAGSGGTRYLRPSSPTKETPLSAGAAEGAAGGALSGMIYVRNGGYYTKNEMEDLIKQGKVQAKTSSDGTVYFDYVFGSGGGNR